MEIFDTFIAFNSVRAWLIALGVLVGVFGALWLVKILVVRRLQRLAERTVVDIDDFLVDLLARTNVIFLLVLAAYAASLALFLEAAVRQTLGLALFMALIFQAGLWGNGVIHFFLQRQAQKQLQDNASSATTLNAFSMVAKLVLWSIIILVALDNLPGVEVTSLIASLGVAGVAVGLAVQNILSDLFASLSIALDKPFVIGDYITVGDLGGSVEHIGLKSTRLRSLSGEQLIFSNSDLLSSRIRNFKRMARRRVSFELGLAYETPADKVRQVPEMVKEIIAHQEGATFDRSHFKGFGSFSLDFESVYYVENPDFMLFMDVQQAINLEILDRFTEAGIEFAYPTQTLFVRDQAPETEERVLS